MKKEDIQKLFYLKDGFYKTNLVDINHMKEDKSLVYETVLDMLREGELRFIYCDETYGHSGAYLVLRKNNRLLMEYLFFNGTEFTFNVDKATFVYPKNRKLSISEKEDLAYQLPIYIKYTKVNLIIDNHSRVYKKEVRMNERLEIDLVDEGQTLVLILAKILRLLIIATPLGLGYLCYSLYGETGIFIGFGTGIILSGIYLFIGVKNRYRHIYCFFQFIKKRAMTPNDIDWQSLPVFDLYIWPFILIFLGLASVVYGLVNLFQ